MAEGLAEGTLAMELIPENVDGAVVMNATYGVMVDGSISTGVDLAVGVHNWLLATEVPYIIIDLQDEKEISEDFLEEILQLWRRLRIPFLFVGVMPRPEQVLESYNYMASYPTFTTPENAIDFLKDRHPGALTADLEAVVFGEPIPMNRSKQIGPRDEQPSQENAQS